LLLSSAARTPYDLPDLSRIIGELIGTPEVPDEYQR